MFLHNEYQFYHWKILQHHFHCFSQSYRLILNTRNINNISSVTLVKYTYILFSYCII